MALKALMHSFPVSEFLYVELRDFFTCRFFLSLFRALVNSRWPASVNGIREK